MKPDRWLTLRIPIWIPRLPAASRARAWLPSRGSVLFTLLVVGGLMWAQAVGAVPGAAPASPEVASTGTMAYQGRLANPAGEPLTGTYGMIFRLYAASTGGTPLWEEQWTGPNSAQVSDGLFNVMLGSLTPIPEGVMTGNSSLWLGITVGSDDEMAPRVQLGSVPFAVQAITVPDGSVTTAKIADGAVTAAKLAAGVGESPFIALTLGSPVSTTSVTTADFGTIEVSETSDLLVIGRWILQNNSSALGMSARLKVDGVVQDTYGGVEPFSAGGIGYTVGRTYFVPNVGPGSHTIGLEIGQFPFQTGHVVHVRESSVTWVQAIPLGE